MAGLPLPESPRTALSLADWLELSALISADANASYGDLSSALRHEGASQVEQQAASVFGELRDRVGAAASAYPFEVADNYVQCRDNWRKYPAYIFCLCLSYFGAPKSKRRKTDAPRLFEYLSREAARHFLGAGGRAVRFGSPRDAHILPRSFPAAIGVLCSRAMMGEGGRYADQPALRRKDDGVDVVAWRDFPDALAGKLMLFGNCASGRHWREKTHELDPREFCGKWMAPVPSSRILKTMFIPHRVQPGDWRPCTIEAGILFDRCRIAYWADSRPWDAAAHLSWAGSVLARIRANP